LNSVSNAGLATANATAVGFNIWDSSVGGKRILWGTVTANIGCKSGDMIVLLPGALKIILA
jgi:hypothetical protein